MISNLRARPIQGHVTDSAGNIIRNSNIVIYRSSPDGSVAVDRAESDDEGYFISNPLPNGIYDIFESGIRTSRVIHNPDQNAIQCFKASRDNYFENDITPFSTLVDNEDLNNYKYFLQIEPESISVDVYGNMFPIYEKDLSVIEFEAGDLYYLKTFLNLRTNSRITITRFDVEYYLPQTATQSSYRRIKWAGIPGIRFKADSKLVVPLDYYSIVANNPFKISKNGGEFAADEVYVDGDPSGTGSELVVTITGVSSNSDYRDVYNNIGIGDILRLTLDDTPSDKIWYGIVLSKSNYSVVLENWKSSRFISSGSAPVDEDDVLTIKAYHGMFQGMTAMSSTVSDYFTVVENVYQQSVESELYDYSGGS